MQSMRDWVDTSRMNQRHHRVPHVLLGAAPHAGSDPFMGNFVDPGMSQSTAEGMELT